METTKEDDLMMFEGEENRAPEMQDDDTGELSAIKVPSLVQSPVVAHSILKQSTKDNLIQLYTPKPEKGKLKVHFATDRRKLQDENEDENTSTGCERPTEQLANEASDPVSGMQGQTSEAELEDLLAFAEKLLKGQDSATVVETDTQSDHDNQTEPETVDKPTSEHGDLHGNGQSENSIEQCKGEVVEKCEDLVTDKNNEKIQDDKANQVEENNVINSGEQVFDIEARSEQTSDTVADKEGEQMDWEAEPMDVDEDDEIVFNIKPGSEASTPGMNAPEQDQGSVSADHCTDSAEMTVAKTVDESNTDVAGKENADDPGEVCGNDAKVGHDSDDDEEFMSAGEEMEVDEPVTLGKPAGNADNSEDTTMEMVESDLQGKPVEDTTSVQVQDRDEAVEQGKLGGDAGSGAGMKTRVKLNDVSNEVNTEVEPPQASPGKTPPKVGYSLNFDDMDLEAMNPFATKKSIVNSPDAGKPNNAELSKQTLAKSSAELLKTENTPVEPKSSKQSVTDTDVVDSARNDTEEVIEKNKHEETNGDTGNQAPNHEAKLTDNTDDSKESETGLKDEENYKLIESERKQSPHKSAEDIKSGESKHAMAETVDDKTPERNNEPASPALPVARGAYNLDFLDMEDADPFKPKKQMVNSPDLKSNDVRSTDKVESKETPEQVMNSPVSSKAKASPPHKKPTDAVKQCENNKKEEPALPLAKTEALPEHKAAVTDVEPPALAVIETSAKKEKDSLEESVTDVVVDNVGGSPALPLARGAYNLDFLDMEAVDPFKPKKQMVNSPDVQADSARSTAKAESKGVHNEVMNSPKSSKTKAEPLESDKLEVVGGKESLADSSSEIAKDMSEVNADGSEVKVETSGTEDSGNKESVQAVVKDQDKPQANLDDLEDPFQSKTQIANSPVPKPVTYSSLDFDNLDDVDPFKPKTQMQNSPLGKSAASEQVESVDNTKTDVDDTIVPDLRIEDSKSKDDEKPSNADDKMAVKPAKNVEEEKFAGLDPFAELNPFQTKRQIANSPQKPEGSISMEGGTASEDNSFQSNSLSMDPFKTKTKMANSPIAKDIDENPFVSKSRISNSPVNEQSGDPFMTMSKVASSPEGKGEENPFVTKCRVETTPTRKAEDSDKQTTPTNNSLEGEAGEDGDIFEVHGITRRGDNPTQMGLLEGIDEAQFVPASQVFNDPAAWDMLEKIGSASAQEPESSLSRMSLYVKFDPLVDAPISANRRLSIKVSQLEKVKEYGLDETLLLLGTPPKKRRQSLRTTMLGARITPTAQAQSAESKKAAVDGSSGGGGVAPQKKAVSGSLGSVDLILACSPQKSEEARTNKPMMSLFNNGEDGSNEDLVQELKYSEADVRRIRQELELVMQGQLLRQEQEFSRERSELNKQHRATKKRLQEAFTKCSQFGQAFKGQESYCFQLAADKGKAEKRVKEIEEEKDQAQQETLQVEKSFFDLHKRFEKVKETCVTLKQNVEKLNKNNTEVKKHQMASEEKYQQLKKLSEEKLKKCVGELQKLREEVAVDKENMESQRKVLQMKISNLEKSIQTKTDENKQLTEICDGLLAKCMK